MFYLRKRICSIGNSNIKCSDVIGRVYTVSTRDRECYHLRLLLHNVRGPTSFESLKVVNNVTCKSFEEACRALGLLENDNQWQLAMEEARFTKSAKQLRYLFVTIVVYCEPMDNLQLWEKFKEDMSEDILYRIQKRLPLGSERVEYNEDRFNECLIQLDNIVMSYANGKSLSYFNLPAPRRKKKPPYKQ